MSHADYHTEFDCSCTDCKLRYPKFFTHIAWMNLRGLDTVKKIGDREYLRDVQQELCKRYDVIITDFKTKKQRRKEAWQKRWAKVKVLFAKFKKSGGNGKGISFDDIFGGINNGSSRQKAVGRSKKDYSSLLGNDKKHKQNMDFILGGNNKKQNMDFILGGNKKKENMSYITGRGNGRDTSFLTGRGNRKDLSALYNKPKRESRGKGKKAKKKGMFEF